MVLAISWKQQKALTAFVCPTNCVNQHNKLDPYSDYVGINVSLKNSSSFSFLNVYSPPIGSSPTNGRTDSFSPSILSSSRNFVILGDFNCHHHFWGTKVFPTPVGRKHSIGLSLLTYFPSITLTYLLFSIAPLAVAPTLIFPLLPPLSPFFAPGKCFRTWILITYQFFYLFLFPSLSPQRTSSLFQFSKSLIR